MYKLGTSRPKIFLCLILICLFSLSVSKNPPTSYGSKTQKKIRNHVLEIEHVPFKVGQFFFADNAAFDEFYRFVAGLLFRNPAVFFCMPFFFSLDGDGFLLGVEGVIQKCFLVSI